MLFLLLLVLLLAYCPTFFRPYAFVDDYFWLDLSHHDPADVFRRLAVQGRPLNGLILRFVFQQATAISSLTWIRGITLAGLADMGWMLYLAMRFNGWRRSTALLAAAMACCLPGIQVHAAWATSVPVPLSGILACKAAILAAWAQDRIRRRWPMLIVASLLVFAAMTIYQPTAMLFWPVVALDLLRRECQTRAALKRFAVYFAVASVGFFLAWLVLRHYLAVIPQRYSPQRDSFTHDPLKKLSWFIHHPLVDSMNLFLIWPWRAVAIAVELIIVAGLAKKYRRDLLKVLIALALLPLSYLPNLVVEESWASYRTQVALSWTALILLFIALSAFRPRGKWWDKFSNLSPSIALFAAMGLSAYHVLRFFVVPQSQELLDLRAQLPRANIDHIILLQPGATNLQCPFSRDDEFGRNSLNASWVPQSAVNLIREEADPNAPRVQVQSIPDFKGNWTAPLPAGTILIDMRVETQEN